jgi:cation/acetate symporter
VEFRSDTARTGAEQRGLIAGLALGSSAVPASLLATLTGLLFLQGQDALVYGLGLMGGLVAATVLMASRLRATGAQTVPAYLEQRFGTTVAVLGTIVLVLVSLLLLTAELSFVGLAAERGLGHAYSASVILAAVIVAAVAVFSGARGVTPLQAMLYGVLAAGLTIALMFLAGAAQGIVLPYITYGAALQEIGAAERTMLEGGLADLRSFRQHTKPFLDMDELNFVALFATLMAGTAALPHIVTRFFAQPTRRSARLSAAWGALFVLVLLITLPALAAFAKLALFKLILAPTSFADLPAWFERLSRLDLVRFHGVSLRLYEDALFAVQSGQTDVAGVTGVLKSHAAPTFDAWVALKAPAKSAIVESAKHVATASGVDPWDTLKTSVLPAVALISGNKTGALTHSALTIDVGGLLYLLPGLSSAPALTAWLIASAVLAAVLSTCTGVALTLANALSNRLQAMRLVAAGSIVIATLAAIFLHPSNLLTIILAAFSLAAVGLFPVLVLGLWWKRANSWGAAAGLVVGLTVTLYYIVGTQLFPAHFYETWAGLSNASETAARKFASLKAAYEAAQPGGAKAAAALALNSFARGIANWFGIHSGAAAAFGLPLALIVMLVVARVTPRNVRA